MLRRITFFTASVFLVACSDQVDDDVTRQDLTSDIGAYKVIQVYSPLVVISNDAAQEGIALFNKTLVDHEISPRDIQILTQRLSKIFSDINESQASTIEPVVNGLADIRQYLNTLHVSGVITPSNAAFLAEVPGAIVCQRAGCSVTRTIAGRSCALIANFPWFGGWICVYLCNPF